MKRLSYILSVLLAGGVIVSWVAVYRLFAQFWPVYGNIFRFRDCAFPNPLATPCFYGAVAFLIAFIWSLTLLKNPSLKSAVRLKGLLIFGTVFALSVLIYEVFDYYKIFSGPIASCAPGVPPLETPCFYGLIFFATSAITCAQFVRRLRSPVSGDITSTFTQQ